MSDSVAHAIEHVRQQIHAAEAAAGRTAGSVRLLAVSKTFPASAVQQAYAAGQRAFGENYVQELQTKAAELAALDIEWHFIGPLQSNKTRIVAEAAHWVHSIERLKIAQRLSEQRPDSLPPLQVCVQVNVSGEASKSGCAPQEAKALALAVAALPRLQLRGLMCIPEPTEDAARLAGQFALLQQLQQELRAAGLALDTVSMGMSADMAQAIAAGSTMVRVGTAIFGARHYHS
ncbi:YggS family pyridoxal phosphate-dependent enzyme [Aquitalea sp. FJL05]|uniref:YggS family pyridoxal phosphate-dependent enzyme n=1 Tax=Aquitalea sp. FJL05 TaxID=2153366 RepID=UPI000F5B320C|nr:YggS family pyridoxal phosphate-dependent enzyme [Aquitalea sp. FJL05]RQO77566.1 YggS family pyridoxal phosphate-dependent enzyme [Aquitalea sp. FJL05]